MCWLGLHVLGVQEQSRDDAVDLKEEDVIPNTPSLITFSSRGYIKRMPVSAWDVQKRGGKGKQRRPRDLMTMQWLS
jgi:DNA gyrase/topoisomerase IV subunit A